MSNKAYKGALRHIVLGLLMFELFVQVPAAVSEQLVTENICADKRDDGSYFFITEADTGKTFTYRNTSRFGICLDEKKYPLNKLDTSDCDSIMGYVSNWSLRGPDNYPIGFEITGVGSCMVRNGAFHVRIVGTKLE